MDYDLFEHRHRFAAWASARATQRGWKDSNTAVLVKSIESSGIVEMVRAAPKQWPATVGDFDRHHLRWCRNLMAALRSQGVKNVTFGRAAKLIAVYLKTMVVVGGFHDTPLANIAFPPIDQILLKSLADDDSFDAEHRKLWRRARWTTMTEEEHAEIIESFRIEGLDQPAFWMIERFWRPSRVLQRTGEQVEISENFDGAGATMAHLDISSLEAHQSCDRGNPSR